MTDERDKAAPATARKRKRGSRKFPMPPSEVTAAARAFVQAAEVDMRFFNFIIHIVLSSDYGRYIARQALDGKEIKEIKDRDATQLAQTDPGPFTKYLRENRQVLLEMFVARLVDNFQKYLVDLIREILRSKPAMLSTRQQSLTLEELLKYERIEDLVHDIIERRVSSLSYEGFATLQEWSSERGIQIKVPVSQRPAVVELIATRNTIAHSRGIVDERYARTVRPSKFAVGACRTLEVDDLFDAIRLLNGIVFKTDQVAREKFGLTSVKILLGAKSSRKPE